MAIADRRDEEPTTMDLAYAAARRGERPEVARLLALLRAETGDQLSDLAEELERLVECVRAHPSFDGSAAAEPDAS